MVKPLLSSVSKRIDKIGYVTDIEGDRKFWWKYVKMSKILDIVPDNDEKQQEKFKVILKPHCHFVFGGDINDQYDGDIEVVEEVLKLKRQYPDRVHFILGNRDINKLRMTQELSNKHVKEYQWNETYPGTFWTQIFFKGLSPYEQIRSKGVKTHVRKRCIVKSKGRWRPISRALGMFRSTWSMSVVIVSLVR